MNVALKPPRPKVTGDPSRLRPEVRQQRSEVRVALVSMPFQSMLRPSVQLGTLCEIARSHGFPAQTFHMSLEFAKILGVSLFDSLCEHRGISTGDWLFSLDAFGDDAPDHDNRFLDVFGPAIQEHMAEEDVTPARLSEMREVEIPQFLDRLMEIVDWEQFAVVGFSSTFQQNTASFALARRLKERYPHITTLFGGSNFEGVMGVEWVRSLPMIDYAIAGEADVAFTRFLVALADGTDPTDVPGVIGTSRTGELVVRPGEPPFDRMDELPIPDYAEFFERAQDLELLETSARRELYLPFESARGCWWGAKRHCTFCGLNGGSMSFRTKSADRVEAEMHELVRRYHSYDLEAVDNIMERDFIDDIFPRLQAKGTTYRIFYEVKADLTREQIRTVRLGGVRRLQPGIESLSTHVLALMRKGVRASQNVNMLRWCRYYGVAVSWNLIWGFPGEKEEDYREMADLMPNLVHLDSPEGCGRIWMARYSPIFNDREAFPAKYVKPEGSMPLVYPEYVDLEQTAYFFDYEFEDALPDDFYVEVGKLAAAWVHAQQAETPPELVWWQSPGMLQIEDLRRPDDPGTYTFEDPLASLYLACSEKPVKAEMVHAALDLPYPVEEVRDALQEFVDRGLMMRDGNLFLALAIPATGGLPRNCGSHQVSAPPGTPQS
jgi:ribosomal peptide maturation radical SAM protein 1